MQEAGSSTRCWINMCHKEKTCVFTSLGQKRYLSAVALADVVIGNSSSGLSEVPSFHVPTVNIGDRQKGRECGESVISCSIEENEIETAIHQALTIEFNKKVTGARNPYEQEGTSDCIILGIKDYYFNNNFMTMKSFYDL